MCSSRLPWSKAHFRLGAVLLAQGDIDGVYDALTESLRLARVTGPRLLIAAALEGLGSVLVCRGGRAVQQAVRMLSAGALLRPPTNLPTIVYW